MAEGYLKYYAKNRAEIFSAGIEAHGVNPRAVSIMKEDGVDISGQTSNLVAEYLTIDFDFIITVCDNARERCPYFPSKAVVIHHNFPDPSNAKGSPLQIEEQFRNVRDLIKQFCQQFVTDEMDTLTRVAGKI
jgi:arsenate reductase